MIILDVIWPRIVPSSGVDTRGKSLSNPLSFSFPSPLYDISILSPLSSTLMPKILTLTPPMEKALLQSLVDSCRNGKRAGSGYKKEAWIIIKEDVRRAALSTPWPYSGDRPRRSRASMTFMRGKWEEWTLSLFTKEFEKFLICAGDVVI